MKYARMTIEKESPEEYGYDRIRHNLSESSIADQTLAEIGVSIPGDLKLLYGEHRGDPALRALVAGQEPGLSADHVLMTAGAAGALFLISTTLLSAQDHLVVVRPNYATNIETPRAIGCAITFIDIKFEDGFAVDLDAIQAALRPNTRFISVTCPHNPTGTVLARTDLDRLILLAERQGCHLLVDETYRDLSYGTKLPAAASLSNSAISVASLSKAYGIPGIRVGWLITRDAALYERFLAAKEQVAICGSVLDELVATQMLQSREEFLGRVLPDMRTRLDLVQHWIDREPLVDWVRPSGGVVGFPRLKVPTSFDAEAFYKTLLEDYGTYVGPGHWFEMPRTFFRIGFGWPTVAELKGGLESISSALKPYR